MLTPRHLQGFTMIELMIGLAILALLVVLAAPNYAIWVADTQIRTGAETVAEGLRYAQAEAIRRDSQVQVVINPTTGTGGWTASLVNPATPLRSDTFKEGASQANFTVTPAGLTTVTFTGLGGVAPLNNNATAPFDTVVVTSPIAGSRTLRVLVGGTRTGIKICDPKWPATDPKGCPALGG